MDAKSVNLSKEFVNKISPDGKKLKLPINGVKKIIAISSGKGGVGKSTICANLAMAAEQMGKKVGILDADIYGPSIPQIFNVFEKPSSKNGEKINPIKKNNIKLISIGFLIDQTSPMVWRGPMVIKAIKIFTENVEWEELDYLFIDMPPGTGDAILTFAETIAIDGAIVITTPQILSLNDTNRGIQMFKKTNVPILGIIENMSYILNLQGEKTYPFGKDGVEEISKKENIILLDKIPLNEDFNNMLVRNKNLKEIFLNIFKNINKNFI